MHSAGASAPIDVDALPPPRPDDLASSALFGQKYTHAASILDMQGRNAIIFVFSVRVLFSPSVSLQFLSTSRGAKLFIFSNVGHIRQTRRPLPPAVPVLRFIQPDGA